MKTMNSLSGGKTSSYVAVKYPADYNVFALVTTRDNDCKFPDKKLRQKVSDKIGKEFIGTLEEDMIIYTMFDLEQYIGKEISWVAGKTFDETVARGKNGKIQLPTPMMRFCTVEMKIEPIFNFWKKNIKEVVETRIGFRANETRRANIMMERCKPTNGIMTFKTIIGKSKNGKRNKWADIPYQVPRFPLIENNVYKDTVEKFWSDKNVRFAYMNNCVGCMHRNPLLLRKMFDKEPVKMNWFVKTEKKAIKSYKHNQWKADMTYDKIGKSFNQYELFDEDFNECDSGYCGI